MNISSITDSSVRSGYLATVRLSACLSQLTRPNIFHLRTDSSTLDVLTLCRLHKLFLLRPSVRTFHLLVYVRVHTTCAVFAPPFAIMATAAGPATRIDDVVSRVNFVRTRSESRLLKKNLPWVSWHHRPRPWLRRAAPNDTKINAKKAP